MEIFYVIGGGTNFGDKVSAVMFCHPDAISSPYLFSNHYILYPYRIDSLINQTSEIDSERILVDKPTKQYITEMRISGKNKDYICDYLVEIKYLLNERNEKVKCT